MVVNGLHSCRRDFKESELDNFVLHPEATFAASMPKDDMPREYWIYQVSDEGYMHNIWHMVYQ